MTPVRKMYFHLLSLQEGASAWLRTHSLARVPPARAHLCFPASSGYTQFPPTFPPLPEEMLGLVLRFLRDISFNSEEARPSSAGELLDTGEAEAELSQAG